MVDETIDNEHLLETQKVTCLPEKVTVRRMRSFSPKGV